MKTSKPKKRRMSLSRARALAVHYGDSLMPCLDAAPIWNAAAIAFFNPALTLDQAFVAADEIAEARRTLRKADKLRRRKEKHR